MIVLDATIVNVALPSIQEDLGFSQSNLAWVVNAYLISFGGLLLLVGPARRPARPQERLPGRPGRVHDRVAAVRAGCRARACWSAARFAQGVGGALASAVILGMIVTMFPEPREQAKAIGVYSFVASAGASIGLLAGGVLTQSISWHWIFFVNIPIGVAHGGAGVAAASSATRASASERRRRRRRRARHERADAGRLHDRQGGGPRLGLGAHARVGRAGGGAAGRLRRARGDREQPAGAAAHLPLPQRDRAPTWPRS